MLSHCATPIHNSQRAFSNRRTYVLMQASSVSEELMKTEYDAARLIYNRFKSAISYKPTIATVLSPDVSIFEPACFELQLELMKQPSSFTIAGLGDEPCGGWPSRQLRV